METTMESIILKELREFRAENNKRWQENDKRWEENDRRWEQNEKRWEINDKKLEEMNQKIDETNVRIDETNQRLDETNERVTALEEGRKKDRKDILIVLDTMEKSISNQFAEMMEYFDAKFDKVFSAQRLSDIEDEKFKKIFCNHEKRLNFYNARLNYLEEWKEQFDLGEYTAV